MRVLPAGLFVFVGMLLTVILLGDWMERVHPVVGGMVMSLIFLVLVILAFLLFNWFDVRQQSSDLRKQEAEYEQQLREWEAQGLISTSDCYFTRVLLVEEDEYRGDEASHYFFNLDDGTLLYLYGHDYVLLKVFAGSEYVPVAKTFSGHIFNDGDIITDCTYDQLLTDR